MLRSKFVIMVTIVVCIGFSASCSNTHRSSTVRIVPTVTATIPLQETSADCQPVPPVIDDRSSAAGFIRSYYNAIARKDYLRAYLYQYPLDDLAMTPTPVPAGSPLALPQFASWRNGYNDTGCTIVTYVGATKAVDDTTPGYAGIKSGMVVPILLTAFTRNGEIQQFQGTYAISFDPQRTFQQSGALVLALSQLSPA